MKLLRVIVCLAWPFPRSVTQVGYVTQYVVQPFCMLTLWVCRCRPALTMGHVHIATCERSGSWSRSQ